MYTQEDVRKLFTQRGEIEMELKVRQAQYYGRETETLRRWRRESRHCNAN